MRLCSFAPGEALVGDIPREDVFEDVFGLPGHSRAESFLHQLPALQPAEVLRQIRRLAVQQKPDGRWPEHATHHGRGLKGAFLGRRQEVDPGGEHALDVVGNLNVGDALARSPAVARPHDQPFIDQVPDDLLQEERVPLCAFEDPSVHGRREFLHREQEGDQSVGLIRAERL